MHYYIISFFIYIDGEDMGTLLIGQAAPTTGYKINFLLDSIIKQYRKNYPCPVAINVMLLEAKEVSQNQYNSELKKLVEINQELNQEDGYEMGLKKLAAGMATDKNLIVY